MPTKLDIIGQHAILQCYHDLRRLLGQKNAADSAEALMKLNPRLSSSKQALERLLSNQNANSELVADASEAARRFLVERKSLVRDHYNSAATQNYLLRLLEDVDDEGSAADVSPASIFNNWLAKSHPTDRIETGLYQAFRRYKPIRTGHEPDDLEWQDDTNHFVICELIFFDLEARTCSFVTAEREKYSGTLYISEGQILFALFQRPVQNKINAFNHRFLVLELEKVKHLFSGLLFKIGDTISKPLAAEILLHRVGPQYRALIDAFHAEVLDSTNPGPISSDSLLLNFMTATPPATNIDSPDPNWRRVRRVRDFPILAELVKRQQTGKAYLREPSRSMSLEDVHGVAKRPWKVFEQDLDTKRS